MGNVSAYQRDEKKMFTYLRGFLTGADFQDSLEALTYARQKHLGQYRKGGKPYIIHPLEMACYALAMGIREDKIIATILLHDVVEDCNVSFSELPVSNDIKEAVRYLTIVPLIGETKEQTKERYFNSLLENRIALIVKAIDRYMNLSEMAGVLSLEAIKKNVKETDNLLLPKLKMGRERWPKDSNIFHVLKENISKMNNTLAICYDVYSQ